MAKGSTLNETFAGLPDKLKLFLRNRKKEKETGILIIDAGISIFIRIKQRHLRRSVLSLRHILYLILPCFREANKLR